MKTRIIYIIIYVSIIIQSLAAERHFGFNVINNGPGYAYSYFRAYYGPNSTLWGTTGRDIQAGQTWGIDFARYSDGDWPVLIQVRAASSAVGFDSATNIGNFTVSLAWVTSNPNGVYTNLYLISSVFAEWTVINQSGQGVTYSYKPTAEGQTVQVYLTADATREFKIGPFQQIFNIDQFVYFKTADGWNSIIPGGYVPDSCWTGGKPLVIIGPEGIDENDGHSPTNTPAITGDTNTVEYPTNAIPARTNAAGPWAMEVTLEDVGRIVHLDMMSITKINQLGFGTANEYLLEMKLGQSSIAQGITNIVGSASGIKNNTDTIANSTTQILTKAIKIGDDLDMATNLLGAQLILDSIITNEIGDVIRSQIVMTNQINKVTNLLTGTSNNIVTLVTNLGLVTNILTKISTNSQEIVKGIQDTTNLLAAATNLLGKIGTGITNVNTNGGSPYGVNETLSQLAQMRDNGLGGVTGQMYAASGQMNDLGGGSSHSYNPAFFKITIFSKQYNLDPFSNPYLSTLLSWFRYIFYWVFCLGMFFLSYKIVREYVMKSFTIGRGPSGATNNPISFGVALGGVALTIVAYGVFISAAYGMLGPSWLQTVLSSPFEASGPAAQGIGMLFAIFPIQDMFNCLISFITLSTMALVAYVALGYQQKTSVS